MEQLATPTPNEACARCGRAFYCGANTDRCWCDEVVLTDEQRAALAATGLSGCLCRECLESLGDQIAP